MVTKIDSVLRCTGFDSRALMNYFVWDCWNDKSKQEEAGKGPDLQTTGSREKVYSSKCLAFELGNFTEAIID